MPKDTSEHVMREITAGHIAQEPAWKERTRMWACWALALIAVLTGALALAVLFYLHSGDTLEAYGRGGALFVLRNFPYFWFVALILFFLLGERYYRRTIFGHRYRLVRILGAYVVLTLFLGGVGHMFGLGAYMEGALRNQFSSYRVMVGGKEALWDQPTQGLLAGSIKRIHEKEMLLHSFSGTEWTVDLSDAFVRGGVALSPDVSVKLFGVMTGEHTFRATDVRPWEGQRGGRNHGARSLIRDE
jgi:hypothetical protein